MKKLTKILILALSVALLCGAFVFGASAAGSAPAATTVEAFEVTDAEGTLVGKYVTLKEAFTAVTTGGKIKMIADFEAGPNNDNGSLSADKQNVTLDLNGHKLSVSYGTRNKTDGTEALHYQKYSISGSLTVVGKGTIEAATSAFFVGYGGVLTFDAGKGKTINLVAKPSYNANTLALSTNVFPGAQFIKVGPNAGGEGVATVNVKGNLTFTDTTERSSMSLFAVTDGTVINFDGANVKSEVKHAQAKFAISHFSGTYDSSTYEAPQINVNNSTITSPYGVFLDAGAANPATDYSDAMALTVTDSILNFLGTKYPTYGEGQASADIKNTNNKMLKVVMTGTKIYTDSNVFYTKSADEVPNTTVQFNDCQISIDTADKCDDGSEFTWSNTYNYRRYVFYGIVTAIVDDTVLVHEPHNMINNAIFNTHAYCDKATAESAGKTDPGYFEELGMGVLFKSGCAFVDCRNDVLGAQAAPGAYGNNNFTGYALESEMILIGGLTWVDGVPLAARVVSLETDAFDVLKNSRFEDATVGTYTDGTQVNGYYGAGIDTTAIKDRNGRYTVCEYGGNKYVTHVAQDGTATYKTDPFISVSLNAGSSPYTAAIDTARFYSFEIDMAKAAAKHSQGSFTVAFLFRPSASYVNVQLSTDANGKSVWKIGSKTLTDAPVAAAGEWQHVQVIIEAPVNESGAFDKAGEFNVYLYLDGKIAGSATLSEANKTVADSIKNATDLKTVAITEVRYKFPGSYVAGDTGSTAFDNILLTRYPIAYTGGKTTAEDIFASVVNTKYALPENLPLVEVDGMYFSDFDEAFGELVYNAFEGYVPTLKYLMDVSSMMPAFNPKDYDAEEGAQFTFVTFGQAPTLAPACGYIAEAVEGKENTYLVRSVKDDEKVNVTWLDNEGNELRKDEGVIPGTALTAPEIENPVVIDNEYYKVTYDVWKVVDGDIFDEIAPSADVTVQLTARVEATFADALFNLTLNDNVGYQVYLPYAFTNNEVENVKYVSATWDGGVKNPKATPLTINNGSYSYYEVGYVGYNGLGAKYTLAVNYEVVVDGETYNLSRTFTAISAVEYVQYVLNGNYAAYEKAHIANFVRFANEFLKVKNGAYDATINGIYESCKTLCSAYEEGLLEETEVDFDPLAPYVSSVYVKVSNSRAQYSIDFKENSKVTGVSINITRNGSTVSGGKYDPQDTFFDGTSYYSNFSTANLKFFNFFGTLTIELTIDGLEETVVGTYDINTWYNETDMSETEKANWGVFCQALKELGDSLQDYRYNPNNDAE